MSKLSRMKMLVAAAVLPLMLAGAGTAQAEIQERTIKFAAANNKGHPQVMGMEKFAEIVKEKSGGKLDVKLFPGGTLGGDVQVVSSLQGGVVEMLVLNAGILQGNAKPFAAVDLPFLFDDGKEADAVMDGPFGDKLKSLLPEKGLVGLAYWELGFRNITNNKRPIEKVEDIAGLKIRIIQSPIFVDLFTALGANPVPMPYTELYTALETGTVDGQENPFANIVNAKFYEVQKYVTASRHLYNPQIVLVSKSFWDGLDPEEQKILQDAAIEARDYQRQAARDFDAKARAELEAKGMTVTDLAPAEVEKLRAAVKPVVDKYRADVGADVADLLFSELEKARAQ